MPQAENNSADNDDALRRFIDRLEDWPEDDPPSAAELRSLRREIRLTQDDRDKLEILSENHIRRARSALAGGAYDQAAAELARAAQLRPLDSRPRTELAGIYLQRSLERGYGRNDRTRAVRLARKALELNPGDPEAKAFLQEYRRMNADFRMAKNRRFIFPGLTLLAVLIVLALWQRDWVVELVRPSNPMVTETAAPPPALPDTGGSRPVEVEARGLENGSVSARIETASVGRRNDASFVDIRGRLRSETSSLAGLVLLLRGRDAAGNALFEIPVPVRDSADALLRPGDSQSMTIFRWLADSEAAVDRLEMTLLEAEFIENPPPVKIGDSEVVWDAARPEGAALEAEIRDPTLLEAYDRQVLLMDLALMNAGMVDLDSLSVEISVDSRWPSLPLRAVGSDEAALARSERRVWALAMGFPLDAELDGRPVTVRITEAGR